MKEWIEILLRSLAMFLIVLVVLRLLGKRQPSRTTPFGFVTYLIIAVISALLSVKIIRSFAYGLLGLSIWVLLSLALEYLAMKSKWVHDVVFGKETILMKQGKVMEDSLLQVRMTGEELLRALRAKNVFNVGDVEFAVMETTGDINVVLKSDKKPVTAFDLGQKVAPRSEPQTVILDGNIMDEPLANLGLNRAWLQHQLDRLGVSVKNIFIGQVDSSGELYADLYDDAIHLPQPKVKELVYANLEKVQADLSTYALETMDQEAKSMYARNAERLGQALEKLAPHLLR